MLEISDPNATRPFIFTRWTPTGDRLTRYVAHVLQFATEAEAIDAFEASSGKASVVELTGIGTCRPIARRSR